jgi:hypothetical protein
MTKTTDDEADWSEDDVDEDVGTEDDRTSVVRNAHEAKIKETSKTLEAL